MVTSTQEKEIRQRSKQTEVGIIPEDWNVRNFADLYAEPSRNGIYKTAEFQGRGTRIVNMGEMFGLDFISDQEMSRVALTAKELAINGLEDKDLLFGRRSVVPAGAGKCSIVVNPHESLTFESSIIRVRLNQTEVCPLYYYYFFASAVGRAVMSTIVSGTNIKGIRASELGELKLPQPPLSEQLAIAAILNAADILIEGLDKMIAKKRAIEQGAMQELLTGKHRLPGFSGRWEAKKLEEVVDVNMGQSPNSNNYNIAGYGTPLIQGNADIENRKSIKRVWTTQKTKSCKAGDVIMTVRAPVGLVARASEDSCIGRGVCSFKIKGIQKDFLFHSLILNENAWKILEQGSTFTAANSSQIKVFELDIPPTHPEQTAIATILSNMDIEIEKMESRLAKYRDIKQGMMQVLLTGKIRLKTH